MKTLSYSSDMQVLSGISNNSSETVLKTLEPANTQSRETSKQGITVVKTGVGIGARSFNIDRSSHGTADIDTYYQHFNIETSYKNTQNNINRVISLLK